MKRGHKNPTWDTELSLRRTNEDVIRFEVWDKDILTKNDLIGAGDLPFSRIFAQNGIFKDWIPLTFKNKNAGELLVSLEFIPDYGVNMQDESTRFRTTATQPTMMGSTIPTQAMTNTQPLTTTTQPFNTQQMTTIPATTVQTQPLMSSTTQTVGMAGMAGMGTLPVSSERGFAQNTLPTGQQFTDPLGELERARERDEGYIPGGIGRHEKRLEHSDYRDEKHLDKEYRDEKLIDRGYREERYGQYAQEGINRGQFTQPMSTQESFNRSDRGSYIPDHYRIQDQNRNEMIRSQQMMPGYSTGIVAYQPIIGQSEGGYVRYEPRFEEKAWEQNKEWKQQQLQMSQQMTQQPMMQQNYQPQQQNYQTQQQQFGYGQENVPPTLRQDLNNIEQRISGKTHTTGRKMEESLGMKDNLEYRPLSSQNYDNPLSKQRVGYQREQREYLPMLPESKMTTIPQTQSIMTQLPGVISNPESKYMEPMGKYVTHQGGTHSTVGSVQSHRIISRMADRPDLGSAALDEDARIALGDVPKSYYGENRGQNI
jgi:hypothetical protein